MQKAIDQGIPKDEAIEKLTALTDRYPMDVGLEVVPRIMRMNVANLYDSLPAWHACTPFLRGYRRGYGAGMGQVAGRPGWRIMWRIRGNRGEERNR